MTQNHRPLPDWVLANITVLPVSIGGGPVRLMTANEVCLALDRIAAGRCWRCGRDTEFPEEESALCPRCHERELDELDNRGF